MILNKKDTIEFLHSTSSRPNKGDMNTIVKMIAVGKEVGYQIEKIGIDQFEIVPNYFIRDYSKPVIIDKCLPADLADSEIVDGKPWGKVFEDTTNGWCHGAFDVICYLYKLEDGEKLNPACFTHYGIALAQWLGYVHETKDSICVYYYPRRVDRGYFDWEGKLYDWE